MIKHEKLNDNQDDSKKGKFPEITIQGKKKIIKYQSLNELEKVQNEN